MSRYLALFACLVLAACGEEQRAQSGPSLGDLAEEYLFLELSMGLHDSNHVDAWYGPAAIEDAARAQELSLAEIAQRADALSAELEEWPANRSDRMQLARLAGLQQRLTALRTRIAIHQGQGRTFSFDEEAERLFGVTPPDYDASHFEGILQDMEALVPGSGELSSRVSAFQHQFAIPAERLADVIDAAIAECRRRTLQYVDLPEEERFTLEYVTDKPWSGYNWYQGDAQSLIQINTDLPILIHRAVDLGCHEGYPGHHTYNVLLEQNLVNERGWLEFTLYPLFSAASLIAEGSGNYGIELAFPGDERVAFEKRRLFPLAGLDADAADRYYAVLELQEELSYAGNEAARDYLNGVMSREEAVQWLVTYTLVSPERARQRVDFFDTYRSYVINYNLGRDLVRDYVERNTSSQEERWRRFARLLSSVMLPSDLVE